MNSKVFQDLYLVHERDKDILKTQYVIASSRIRRRQNANNILWAYNALYPTSDVMMKNTEEDKKEEYMNFLERSSMSLLASIILLSIDKKFTIVFICTENEWKLKHLQYIQEFIEDKFDYPVYNYKNYIRGKEKLINVDNKRARKRIKKTVKELNEEKLISQMETAEGRRNISKNFKEMSKKDKKKFLVSCNLYYNGMSQTDMDEIYDTFFL